MRQAGSKLKAAKAASRRATPKAKSCHPMRRSSEIASAPPEAYCNSRELESLPTTRCKDGSNRCEQRIFHKQLSQDAPSAGAQRRADDKLALAAHQPGKLQVGKVNAARQEHQARHDHQQDQRLRVIFAQRAFAGRCRNKLHMAL